jgi:hypothetical protein
MIVLLEMLFPHDQPGLHLQSFDNDLFRMTMAIGKSELGLLLALLGVGYPVYLRNFKTLITSQQDPPKLQGPAH